MAETPVKNSEQQLGLGLGLARVSVYSKTVRDIRDLTTESCSACKIT